MIQAELKSRLDEARQKIPKIKVDWAQELSTDPRDAYNTSKVAILIEPRPLPHLVPQILHMISVVPPDWRFLFIGSNLSVVSVGRRVYSDYSQTSDSTTSSCRASSGCSSTSLTVFCARTRRRA
jgi:16S rRNA G1207 methylase RsmC